MKRIIPNLGSKAIWEKNILNLFKIKNGFGTEFFSVEAILIPLTFILIKVSWKEWKIKDCK
jgi:hypothetical protein